MNEEFISYLWKNRKLSQELLTDGGDAVVVLSPGEQNDDGGPDFFNARVRIGSTVWAGNVEIHLRSSDWCRHGHQHDKAYQNAILHVVYENDQPVRYSDGTPIPTLTVRHCFSPRILARYDSFLLEQQWIPCYNQLAREPYHDFGLWAPSLAMERLTERSSQIRVLWESVQYSWDEAFYRRMAWCFGFRVNNLAFELLARSLPLKILFQYSDDRVRLEALLFGLAGMLEDPGSDEYARWLRREYLFLKAKHELQPVTDIQWKFLRMRPSNFPTIRISQWADLLCQTRGRFFHLIDSRSFPGIFSPAGIQASEYWNTHFMFGRVSVFSRKTLGEVSANLLVINGVVPFMFFYGLQKDDASMREKALDFLERTAPESNAVTERWKKLELPCTNALQSQALLQLKQSYCERKRCLSCRIGSTLLAS